MSVLVFCNSELCVCALCRVLQDTKDKIQKMKEYYESLIGALAAILDKHLPFPQNEKSSNKKKKVQ